MRGGVDEDVSETDRAEVSPERSVLQVYTLYYITLVMFTVLCFSVGSDF